MTASTDDGRSAGAQETLRALRLLARTGARGQVDATGTAEVRTLGADGTRDQAKAIGTIAPEIWEDLETSGLVVPDESGQGWRLAEAGRIRLKRLLSQTGGTETASIVPPSARPAAARQPATALVLNVAESPLAWLRRHKDWDGSPFLKDEQFEAGERLRADFTKGQMMPRMTSSWSPVGAGTAPAHGPDRELLMQDATLAARERVRRAFDVVGPELSGILIDVCCHLKGMEDVERGGHMTPRSGKFLLRTALAVLARHYGLGRSGRGESSTAGERSDAGRPARRSA